MSYSGSEASPAAPFRMMVGHCSGTGVWGDVISGSINIGDEVVFYPSGKRGTVESVSSTSNFTLTEEIYLPPGQIAARIGDAQPMIGTRLRVEVLQGRMPESGKRYTVRYSNKLLDAACEQVRANGRCVLKTEASMIFDTVATLPDHCTIELFAGGVLVCRGRILQGLPDRDYEKRNIRLNIGGISQSEREQMTGHRGLVVWMTGLSGSGKSTIAQVVERNLLTEGIPAYLLDGDKLRRGLTSDLSFTDTARNENQRRVAEVAALFRDAGMVVLVATISPFKKNRDLAREKAGGDFMEVYVRADYDTCQQRDPKQLYQKASTGAIQNFTGKGNTKGSIYEIPKNPDLVLDTLSYTAEETAEQLLKAIHEKLGTDSIEYVI